MAITKEQIFETAEQLIAAGHNPTLAAVRKAVGGGSFTTISEAMSEWRGARQAATAPLREPAPPAIGDRLADLGADVWAIALELASGRLKAEREALESARVDMESQQSEAVELADQMAAEIEQLKGRCADLEAVARAECEGAEQLHRQLSSATERAAAAEVRAGELEARAADLNKELERVHADLGAERQNAAEARQRMKALEETRLSGELEPIKALLIQQTAIIKGMAGAGERKATKKTE